MSRDLLLVPMDDNDADAPNVGAYFREILLTLWREREGFSGKRPFGNSGWEYEPIKALIRAEKVKDGELGDFGDVENVGNAYDVVERAIEALFDGCELPAQTADEIYANALRAELAAVEHRLSLKETG